MTTNEIARELVALFRESTGIARRIQNETTRLRAVEAEIQRLSDLVPEEKYPPGILEKINARGKSP